MAPGLLSLLLQQLTQNVNYFGQDPIFCRCCQIQLYFQIWENLVKEERDRKKQRKREGERDGERDRERERNRETGKQRKREKERERERNRVRE